MGYKHTEETKKKIRAYRHTSEARAKISAAGIGRTYSEERNRKISIANLGPKNKFWRGGITPLHEHIRKIRKYRQWRKSVFERDNYTCYFCKIKGGRLNADHHPKMFAEILYKNNILSIIQALKCKELWNLNNGRTLCESCHKEKGKKTSHILKGGILYEHIKESV